MGNMDRTWLNVTDVFDAKAYQDMSPQAGEIEVQGLSGRQTAVQLK